jgi:predicted small secreted protein
MKTNNYFLLGLCALTLASCETWRGIEEDFSNIQVPEFAAQDSSPSEGAKYISACPHVAVIEDLAVLNDFENVSKPSPDNLVSRVVLTKMQSSCGDKSRSVIVDLKLAFEGTLGPKGKMQAGDMPFFTYPYFVAVTAPNGEIMAKEVFAASITYDRGENTHTHFETLRHIIPLDDTSRGNRYKVMVGFQLSQDQLEYNRNQIRMAQEAEKAKVKAAEAAAKAQAKAQSSAPKGFANQPQATAPATIQPNQPAAIVVTPAPGPVDITSPVQ